MKATKFIAHAHCAVSHDLFTGGTDVREWLSTFTFPPIPFPIIIVNATTIANK